MVTQRSGTFFGFIIGLVAGLAIAAAVAFFLLRSSPVAKKEEPKQEQPAQQVQVVSQSGQQPAADPNQPMYKDTPQRPAKEQSEAVPTPAPAVNRSVPATDTHATAPTPSASPSTKVTPSTKTMSETTKANINSSVYLQAGAFRSYEQADNQRGNLAILGFSSQILQAGSGANKVYRVRLGPYQASKATSIQGRLKSSGFTTTVIK